MGNLADKLNSTSEVVKIAQKVHFLGIGGSGASAAAAVAQSQGFEVSGCDKNPHTEFTTNFDKDLLLEGHSASHTSSGNIDYLVITPAILSLDPNNEELKAAKEKGIPVLTWQEFTGKYLLKNKFVVAVSGTHGKSTTTALIGLMLERAGLDPTVILGATVLEWQANFRVGKGKYLCLEADEYADNFLNYKPDITVVTNIEMDHPEFFKSFDQLKKSYKKFFLQTKQSVVANLQDETVAGILKEVMKESAISSYDYSKHQLEVELKIPGEHNRLNTMAVLQVGLLLGIDTLIIKETLEKFTGISRRFEYMGDYLGAKVYSDFGHHPTEIKVTMEAARLKFPDKKIWLFYQPHMFTRTKILFDDFVKVFQKLPIDQAVILDIYPSREKDTGMIHSSQLAQAIKKPHVRYESPEGVKETLVREIGEGDILFFMGAGDIDNLARKLVTNEKKN